jgi:hypothetical protein
LAPINTLSALTPQLQHDSAIENAPRSPTPLLVVAKVDDKPSFGENPGADGTSGEKEAFKKRAADAQPDIVMSVDEYERRRTPASSTKASPKLQPEQSKGRDRGHFSTSREFSDDIVADVIGKMAAAARSSSFRGNSDMSVKKVISTSTISSRLYGPDESITDSPGTRADQSAPENLSSFANAAGFDLDDLQLSPGPGQLAPVMSHESFIPSFETINSSEPEGGDDYFAGSLPSDHDLNDPNIEEFPTDREEVLDLIRSASKRSLQHEANLNENSFADEEDRSVISDRDTSPLEPILEEKTPKEKPGLDYLSLKSSIPDEHPLKKTEVPHPEQSAVIETALSYEQHLNVVRSTETDLFEMPRPKEWLKAPADEKDNGDGTISFSINDPETQDKLGSPITNDDTPQFLDQNTPRNLETQFEHLTANSVLLLPPPEVNSTVKITGQYNSHDDCDPQTFSSVASSDKSQVFLSLSASQDVYHVPSTPENMNQIVQKDYVVIAHFEGDKDIPPPDPATSIQAPPSDSHAEARPNTSGSIISLQNNHRTLTLFERFWRNFFIGYISRFVARIFPFLRKGHTA